ncbi:hypothetical protein [Flagellimonas meridianipacifica]|uniref:YD repeat-containing protein n=1 Tax=Flagellimonas meridianipacifica TaxID=1080225 RepID=A0A2T0MGF6_9FLAO|nr:hypothetical protein [Allomuricauda pacifica]PRX56645.1 hypothetical protein CLV81_0642 [Allomuricauda pacifica]
MYKLLLSTFFMLFIIGKSLGQYPEQPPKELLKKYRFYTHKFEPKSCWKYKYELKNGLVVKQQNYCRNKLTYLALFEYDKFDNVYREIEKYNADDGNVNKVSEIKLDYEDGLLIRKELDYGITEKYSDFTEFGEPKLIEREDEHNIWPYKETFEYDENGNVIKSTVYSTYNDLDDKIINEKATTSYKYDNWNNVVEIHREFEPEQEFPIIMIGGPAKYEFEYFRYKYNDSGLWTKKYKTVNEKEYLIAKRKYK